VILPSGGEGEDFLVLTILRDVTERNLEREELENARRKAEESDQLKSAFLANMSHEIRTPMNSIVGFSNLLVNPGLDRETREMYVSRVVRNSELLLALISDIIDLAKIESGQLPMVYGKQNMPTLAGEMEQYARDEIQRLGKDALEIRTAVECEKEIETDVIRLNQILKNLINNAIKFTDRGAVEIGCRNGDEADTILFFVRDTGIGIDPANFELIFDQFRQIDGSNTREYGGTGLGLAICKNLALIMGGRIWVESVLGEGATFFLQLPVKATRGKPGRASRSEVEEGSPEITDIQRILVVDDEPDSRDLIQEMLPADGFEVVEAANGFDALKVLEQAPLPDLIFMDDQMPVLSGTDTMRIIKDRYPGIRVVAQSAHALVGDRSRFLEDGFDAYLPKPFTRDELEGVLRILD
jgi:CheY-like chemotaxis protein